MVRALVALVMAATLAGCDPQPIDHSDDGKPDRPTAGSKVVLPKMAELWDDLAAMRICEKWNAEHPGEPATPESGPKRGAALHVVKLLAPGALVEVLSVEDDHATVNVVRDRFNEPVEMHGYMPRWWRRAPR